MIRYKPDRDGNDNQAKLRTIVYVTLTRKSNVQCNKVFDLNCYFMIVS